jgi:hypothetical protein
VSANLESVGLVLIRLRLDLDVVTQRASELTELQRQDLLARLLTLAYLLRAPIVGGLQVERTLDGKAFVR